MTAEVIASVVWTSTASSSNPNEGLPSLNASDGNHLWKDGASTFLSVILSLIIVVSITGNALELIVILKSRRMRTKTNIFIANLAVADLGVTVLCMPFSLVTLLMGDYIFSMEACSVNAFCDAFFLLASIHGLLGVSIQNYFDLVKPLSFAITQRMISCMIASAWILAFIAAIGPVLGWTDNVYKPGSSQCGPKYPETVAEYSHGYFNMIVGLVIPLSVFIFVYISVFIAMRRYSRRLRENTTYGEKRIFEQQMQVAKTVFWIVVAFLFLWSPYFIYVSWTLVGDSTKLPVQFNTFAYMCGFTNSALNPVIYGLRTKSFRRELRKMFGFKLESPNQSDLKVIVSPCMEKLVEKPATKRTDIFTMPRSYSLRKIENAFKDTSGCLTVDYVETTITCPFTLKRLVNPCRTMRCDHIQCFDASALPDFEDKKNQRIYTLSPLWKCPICRRPVINLSQVYIDAYFVEVLEKTKTDANIQIFPDGTWATSKDDDEENTCGSPIVVNDSIIDLTNDSVLDSTIIDLTELDITVDEGTES